MDLLPVELERSAHVAREHLEAFSRRAAASNTGTSSTAPQGALAGFVRSAIFADAVLGAIKSRLEELKAVTR